MDIRRPALTIAEEFRPQSVGQPHPVRRRRLWKLLMAGYLTAIAAIGSAQTPPGAETGSTTASQGEKLSTAQVIAGSVSNAQKSLSGESSQAEDAANSQSKSLDDRGPDEQAYTRLKLAWTNLGHLSEQLLPTQEDALAQRVDTGSKVIGSDSRTQVKSTNSYPWSAICHLSVKWPNGNSSSGSGFFISQRTVITAGHVIYNSSRGGWATQVTVSPGRNVSSYPFGKVSVGSSSLFSMTGYTQQGQRPEYDYAAVVLPSSTGASTGYFGYHAMSSSDYSKWTFNVAGYPGDKSSGTMWTAAGPITGTMNTVTVSGTVVAGRVKHTVDTYDGESGSPIWYLSNNSRYVVGVHTGGNSTENWGSRMAKDMVDFIKRRP